MALIGLNHDDDLIVLDNHLIAPQPETVSQAGDVRKGLWLPIDDYPRCYDLGRVR